MDPPPGYSCRPGDTWVTLRDESRRLFYYKQIIFGEGPPKPGTGAADDVIPHALQTACELVWEWRGNKIPTPGPPIAPSLPTERDPSVWGAPFRIHYLMVSRWSCGQRCDGASVFIFHRYSFEAFIEYLSPTQVEGGTNATFKGKRLLGLDADNRQAVTRMCDEAAWQRCKRLLNPGGTLTPTLQPDTAPPH